MLETKTAGMEKGWLDTFKEKLNLDGLTEQVKTSKDKIIEIGLEEGLTNSVVKKGNQDWWYAEIND